MVWIDTRVTNYEAISKKFTKIVTNVCIQLEDIKLKKIIVKQEQVCGKNFGTLTYNFTRIGNVIY